MQNLFNGSSEDENKDISQEKYLNYVIIPVTNEVVKIFIDESIREPKYYRGVIHKLQTLSERDVVILHIDSPGGYLDGAMALIDAMENTQAKTIAVISGMAASAASIIALRADEVVVSHNARMLVHPARYGYVGKMVDVRDHVKFNDRYISKIFEDSYEGFLSPDEITQCIDGKELYMDSEEILERLEKMQKEAIPGSEFDENQP